MKSLLLFSCIYLGVVGGRAQAAPTRYQLSVPRSRVTIHVHKAGALSAMLHDHAFVPQRWRGEVSFDPESPAATRGEIVFDAASLRDEEQALSAADKAKVEEQVRGPDVLDAARYPEVRLAVTGVELGSSAQGSGMTPVTLIGTFHLHGRSSPVRIPLVVGWSAEGFEARGQARFKQSDFGIQPLSKMLGAVAVRDDVLVEIDVRGQTSPISQAQPSP
jgi:polyisoprenoid-binding protein YceI